jgi:hypothetical protein
MCSEVVTFCHRLKLEVPVGELESAYIALSSFMR